MVTRSVAMLLVSAVLIALSTALYAAGGQNADNNSGGDPPDDTYQTPFSNSGGGRMLIYCAEGETLIMAPAEDGAVEAACVPTESFALSVLCCRRRLQPTA